MSSLNSPKITKPKAIRKQQTRKSMPAYSKSPIKQTSRTSTSFSSKKVSLLNDEECVRMRQENWEQTNLSGYTEDELQRLMAHCREFASNSALNLDFKSAKRAQQILEECKEACLACRERDTSKDAKRKTIEEINSEFDEIFNDFEQKYQDKIAKVEKRQSKECEKFESEWKTEKIMKYRKPSQRLLSMNEAFKTLVATGDFDAAESINDEITKLREKETAQQQSNMNKDYEEAQQRLTKKHSDEMEQLLMYKEKEREVIESRKQKEIDLLTRRNAVLGLKDQEQDKKTERLVSSTIKFPINCERNILLDLVPSNDPEMRAEEERKRKELTKKNTMRQKKSLMFLDRYKEICEEATREYDTKAKTAINTPARTQVVSPTRSENSSPRPVNERKGKKVNKVTNEKKKEEANSNKAEETKISEKVEQVLNQNGEKEEHEKEETKKDEVVNPEENKKSADQQKEETKETVDDEKGSK